MEQRIELTPLELAMLRRQLEGKFFPPQQTDEENKALANVIDKASKLMRELDAYDELGTNLMQWFYNKYLMQQTALKE